MRDNVVQITTEDEPRPPANRNLHQGQKQPSPFIHDPAVLFATPAYYLKTPGLAALLEHLQQAITGRGTIQVIIAEYGRGKSSLLRRLVSEGASRWLLCYIHADYHLGVDHIIEGLGQRFFPQEEIDFESLVRGLATYGHREPYPVVIVDDAHNLSAYAVETLANIKHAVAAQGGDLDIILAAPPEFRKVINGYGLAKFREKMIELHSLPRFIEEETGEYLTARFNDEDGTRFTPSQRHIIHRRSCGIPARINYHAELALGHAVSDERLRLEHQQIEARKKKQPWYLGAAAAALLLLALTLFVSLRDGSVDERKTVLHSSPPPPAAAIKSDVVDTAAEQKVSSRPPQADTAVGKPAEKAVKSAPATAAQPRQVVRGSSAVEPSVRKSAPVVVPKAVTPPVAVKETTPQRGTSSRSTVVAPPQAEPAPAVKPVAADAPAPVVAVQQVVTENSEAPPLQANSLPTPAATVPQPRDNGIPGGEWLLAQPPDHFTIQLAGSPSENNIIRYVKRSSLEGELAYVYLERKGREGWYVVLYGSFKTREAARDIVDFFPPELRKNKPWIRRISTLQNALASD